MGTVRLRRFGVVFADVVVVVVTARLKFASISLHSLHRLSRFDSLIVLSVASFFNYVLFFFIDLGIETQSISEFFFWFISFINFL